MQFRISLRARLDPLKLWALGFWLLLKRQTDMPW